MSDYTDWRTEAVEIWADPVGGFWADAEADANREAYADAVDTLEEHATADGYPTVETWLDGEGADHAVSCVGYDALARVYPDRARVFAAA